jgi:uncharacterized coiled-coil protein SlyX
MTNGILKAFRAAQIELAKEIVAINTRFVQGVREELALQSVKQRVAELPAEISKQKKHIKQLSLALDDCETARAQEEAILASIIASEANPTTGKALFTNKEARDAELIIRKGNSPEYKAASAAYKTAELALANAQIDLEQLQNEFKALSINSRTIAKEMALIGIGAEDEEDEHECY